MSNTIHIFRCNCGRTMSGRALERLTQEANPCCPCCSQSLDPVQIRYAANVKNNECQGLLLLPAVILSFGFTMWLCWFVGQVMPQAMPLVALAMMGITLFSSYMYKSKGGSATVAFVVGMFFGPLASVFLAVVGPWRSTSLAGL